MYSGELCVIVQGMIRYAVALLSVPACAISHAQEAGAPIPLIEHQEIYTTLQEHAKSVYRRLPAMDRLYVFDGPGFTRETAWVVDGADLSQAPAAVVRLMFNIYADEARFPVVEFYQDRREIDGTIYLYTGNVILYEGKRYLIEQWVDISAYFRK